MDYKYIEQLIERYFDCQTTLQEEQILRSFFAQEDVPARLMQYADLFNYEAEAAKDELGEDFDEKMKKMVESEEKVVRLTVYKSQLKNHFSVLVPFWRAAAIVAVILTIGNAANRAWQMEEVQEGGSADITAVNPYIRKSQINEVLRIPDVSQAEARTVGDSLAIRN